jgi:hypothetical protein
MTPNEIMWIVVFVCSCVSLAASLANLPTTRITDKEEQAILMSAECLERILEVGGRQTRLDAAATIRRLLERMK